MDQGTTALNARRATLDELPRLAWRPAALAVVAGLVAFVAGAVAESGIIRAVHGNRRELEWLSDAVISIALAGITYLWLHLQAARMRVIALAKEQAVLDEQLRLAAQIQRSLLPDVPESTPGFRWAARMVPAGRVGGDFYDFLQPHPGTVLALLADVSGKGIPAALILSSLKTLFRTKASETTSPRALAEHISAALYQEHGGLPYATAILARFEAESRRLTYVNAGHPAGYLLRNGTVAATVESGGHPLGLFPHPSYRCGEVVLCPGDVGVLVTDGVAEALETGPTTLGEALAATQREASLIGSPAELCGYLMRIAAGGTGPVGAPDWQDDCTVFVFAVDGAPLNGARR